jgi:GNAT superfamily N-acetyltransferase
MRPAREDDFEALLDLSIRVLRADLERLGRFDPERRRNRLRAVFDPAVFRVVEEDGERLGCIAVDVAGDHIALHSFYLEPAVRGRGLGARILAEALAPLPALPVRIEVLKGSRARRFWETQGFRFVAAQDFDDLMERPVGISAAAPAGE